MERMYVVDRDGLDCLRREDGNWLTERVRPAPSLECVAASRDRPERVFCGSFEAGLLRSIDGGQSFERIGADTIESDAVMSVSIDACDPNVVLAGTEPSGLYRSIDGGSSWEVIEGVTEVPSVREWSFPPRPKTHHVRWIEVAPNDPDRWYVGIEAGALLLTTDAGDTWIDRPPGSRRDNHTLATHPDAPARVYSAAGDGYAESRDGGKTWIQQEDGLEHWYVWGLAVDAGDPDTRLISAANGASRAHRPQTAESYVYRKVGEQAWANLADDGLPTGRGVLRPVLARGGDGGVFAAASNRGIYITEHAGDEWERIDDTADGARHSGGPRGLAWV